MPVECAACFTNCVLITSNLIRSIRYFLLEDRQAYGSLFHVEANWILSVRGETLLSLLAAFAKERMWNTMQSVALPV